MFCQYLYDLLLCVVCFIVLIHKHLLPILLLFRLYPPNSTSCQKLLSFPYPYSCTCFHTQRQIYSPARPTHSPNPISPPPGYCTVYQSQIFTPRCMFIGEGGWSCRMWRYRIPISGQGDYIIGTQRRDFYNVDIREPRMSTDHRIILS